MMAYLRNDNGEPILRQTELVVRGRRLRVVVTGGLWYASGNRLPHFQAIYTTRYIGARDLDGFGPLGVDCPWLEHWPELLDLAQLVTSGADLDGAPMHAEANGWYWVCGAVGGLGERFHGGNGSVLKDRAACIGILAGHLRIDERAAEGIVAQCRSIFIDQGTGRARAAFASYVETQRDRWKREADAVIAHHSLEHFGRPWAGNAPAAADATSR